MKKIMNWMIAAILICGASVFTSCSSNDDNPVNPVEPDLNVAEKIIGKWIIAERNGQPETTNKKQVFNFTSATKVFVSLSIAAKPGMPSSWLDNLESEVAINGNMVTITGHPDEATTILDENEITNINDNEFTTKRKLTMTKNGEVTFSVEMTLRFVKVNADYSADIIGMWEGYSTGDAGSEFDDGENHRWEFMTDGNFYYFYKKEDGLWQMSDDDYSNYFVAGNLLCTRWKNDGAGNEEHREWWEIESIENGVMKWKALRQREDGSTYTATFEMKKVNVTDEDLKCSNVVVNYRITSPKTNYTFFEGKFARKSGNEVKWIRKLITFAEDTYELYDINGITTFPVEEAICLHYSVKDGLASYRGAYSLDYVISYEVTSYNANGYKLDTQTISARYEENGNNIVKEDFESSTNLSYTELHASVAEDGSITLSEVNKRHPENSGIDW